MARFSVWARSVLDFAGAPNTTTSPSSAWGGAALVVANVSASAAGSPWGQAPGAPVATCPLGPAWARCTVAVAVPDGGAEEAVQLVLQVTGTAPVWIDDVELAC